MQPNKQIKRKKNWYTPHQKCCISNILIHPIEICTYVHQKLCTEISIAALIHISLKQESTLMPINNEIYDKFWYVCGANIIHTMEYYKMKMSQLLLSSRTQI